METVDNKLGYLRGLLEKESPDMSEGSQILFRGILDVLGELDRSSREMTDLFAELNDYVESIDDDLAELEDGGPFPDADEERGPRLRAVPPAGRDHAAVCPLCGGIFITPSQDRARYVCPHCGRDSIAAPVSIDDLPVAKTTDER